jgi:hypothetical protein
MPFAEIPAAFVLATIVGQRAANVPFIWNPLALAVQFLAPAAVFGFLLALYVSAGRARPARLNDAAMAASVLMIAALAVNLRWTAIPYFVSVQGLLHGAWLWTGRWLVDRVLEPAAWLAFFVTFVRWPAPPLSRASRRAAAWLALAVFPGVLFYALDIAETLAVLPWSSRAPGPGDFFLWANVLVAKSFTVLRWLLLLVFALAAWRIRPAADAPPAPASD